MRILALSDLYPPAGVGGYEIAASEVVGALRARGHDVRVLTTDYRRDAAPGAEPSVFRILRSRLHTRTSAFTLPALALAEARDDRAAARMLAESRPDVVFLWNIGGVSHRVLARLMNGPTPAVVYVFGDWPLRKFRAPHALDGWTGLFVPRHEPPWRRAARTALERVAGLAGGPTRAAALRFDHFEFGSQFMMETFHGNGLRAARSERVVYYGLFGEFARAAQQPLTRDRQPREGPLRVLFVGRVWEAKGVHTVIEALGRLGARGGPPCTLAVVGPPEQADYVVRLHQLAAAVGVADRVQWMGSVERDRLLSVYSAHDVVAFPSVYPEPFGIVQLEAMAAGCPVVGSRAGGSAEVLEDGVNGLAFAPGDADGLAACLERLAADPMLRTHLGEGGRETVRRRFLGSRMVAEVEAHLADIATGGMR